MGELQISVQKRSERGKNASRRLRAAGSIPAVVYGEKLDTVSIQVDRRSMHDLLKTSGG